jgi:UDP-N-acetylglucosamine 2-epimerase (non-hydrolysing)
VAAVSADLHFAPTAWARENLLREGIDDSMIKVTGNTVIDALQFVSKQAEPQEITDLINTQLKSKRLILVTAHRRENFGEPIENICHALLELSREKDVQIVYPVHLNPNVQEPVNRLLKNVENITLLPPLDYLPLVHLMKHAFIILTDSGGIQEEAPAFGIPTLVLREVTERPEGVEAGTLKLVGTQTSLIVTEAKRLLNDPDAYAKMAKSANPYGDGQAAVQIVDALLHA